MHTANHKGKQLHRTDDRVPAGLTRTRTLSGSSAQSSVSGASAVDLRLRLKDYQEHWISERRSKLVEPFLPPIVEDEDLVNNLYEMALSRKDENKINAQQAQEYTAEGDLINLMKDKYKAQTTIQSQSNLTPHINLNKFSEKKYLDDSDEIANSPDLDPSIKNRSERIALTLRSPTIKLTPIRPVQIKMMSKKRTPERCIEPQIIPSMGKKGTDDSCEMRMISKTKVRTLKPPKQADVSYIVPQECQHNIVQTETDIFIQDSASNTRKMNSNSVQFENKVSNTSDVIRDMPNMELNINRLDAVCDNFLRTNNDTGNFKNKNNNKPNPETVLKIKRKVGKKSSKAPRSTNTKNTKDMPPRSSNSPYGKRSLFSIGADFIVQASEDQQTQLKSTTSVVLKKGKNIDKIEKSDKMVRRKSKVTNVLSEDQFDKLIAESTVQASVVSTHSVPAMNVEDIARYNRSFSDEDFQEIICQKRGLRSNIVPKIKKSERLRGRPKKYDNSIKKRNTSNMESMLIDQNTLKSANLINNSNISIKSMKEKKYQKEIMEPKGLEKRQVELAQESDRTNNKVSDVGKQVARFGRRKNSISFNKNSKAIDNPKIFIDELMRKSANIGNISNISIESINDAIYEQEIIEPKGLDEMRMVLAQECDRTTNEVTDLENHVTRRDRTKKTIGSTTKNKDINMPDMLIDEVVLKSANVSKNPNMSIESINDTISEIEILRPKGLQEIQMVLAQESVGSTDKVSNLEKHVRRRGRPKIFFGSNQISQANNKPKIVIDELLLKLNKVDDAVHIPIDLINDTISENEIIEPKESHDIQIKLAEESDHDYIIGDKDCSKEQKNRPNCANVKPKESEMPNKKYKEKSKKRKHSLKENEMVYVNIKRNKTLAVNSIIKSKSEKEQNSYTKSKTEDSPLPPLVVERVEKKKNLANDTLDLALLTYILHVPTSLKLQTEPELRHELLQNPAPTAKNKDELEFTPIEDAKIIPTSSGLKKTKETVSQIPPLNIDSSNGKEVNTLQREKEASLAGSFLIVTDESGEDVRISPDKSSECGVNKAALMSKEKSNKNIAVENILKVKIERSLGKPSVTRLFAKGTSKGNGDDVNLSPTLSSISTDSIIGRADLKYSPPNLDSLEQSIEGRYSNIENLISNPCIANSFLTHTLDSHCQIKRVLDDTLREFNAEAEWHKSEYNKLRADLDRLQEESHCRTSELIDSLKAKVTKILHEQTGSPEARVVLLHEHVQTMLDTYNRNSGAPPLRLNTSVCDELLLK